uniref:Uncharacterized protein n=1 Tax=Glossina pallidipes TaxID=7398 RepID=A0A1A9ZK06_GLOPL
MQRKRPKCTGLELFSTSCKKDLRAFNLNPQGRWSRQDIREQNMLTDSGQRILPATRNPIDTFSQASIKSICLIDTLTQSVHVLQQFLPCSAICSVLKTLQKD